MEITIGIDIGGTNIKGVGIDFNGNIIAQHSMPTYDKLGFDWKGIVAEVAKSLQEKVGNPTPSIGISAPGIPNMNSTAIAYMPGRLEGLENFEWTSLLNKKTFVVNDAVAALLAEHKCGVATGLENVIMVTLGTGVGGAIIINGKPYLGANNLAGHLGHITLNSADEDIDIVGMPGSLENAIGNFNIEKRSNGKFASTKELLLACANLDPFANEIWDSSIKKLAIGLASIINVLSPEMIILGGGITQAEDQLFVPLNKYMDQYEWRPTGAKTKIVKAQYGEYAGAVGAACFAQNKNNT